VKQPLAAVGALASLVIQHRSADREANGLLQRKEKKKKLSACRGEGSAAGLQLRVRFVPAALLAMLRTALAHWLSSV
jgi:hypothetical protein